MHFICRQCFEMNKPKSNFKEETINTGETEFLFSLIKFAATSTQQYFFKDYLTYFE